MNQNTNSNWLQQPSLKTVLLFSTISLIGIFLSLAAMTDLFTETPFQKRYLMMWFLTGVCFFTNLVLLFKYFNKK